MVDFLGVGTGILLVVLLSWFVLRGAERFNRLLGATGMVALTRLMGFPADYPLQGTRADRVKQIGNAVCPPAGAWVVSHALRAAGLLPSGVAS